MGVVKPEETGSRSLSRDKQDCFQEGLIAAVHEYEGCMMIRTTGKGLQISFDKRAAQKVACRSASAMSC